MPVETQHNPTVTNVALKYFAPKPKKERSGIGLALSGGGYRAALFHLGALRRLNELGILAQLQTLSSVSGGSIVSAHLASSLSWPLNGSVSDWEERVARPFRDFTSVNIRNAPVLKRALLPWNWLNSSVQVESLAAEYTKRLTRLRLAQLPESPEFIYCATDLAFGVNWTFERSQMGDYQAGYVRPSSPDWLLAKAVAASSCFPPIFDPLAVPFNANDFKDGDAKGDLADKLRGQIGLSDGGVYDNLGLEPIWKDHAIVICSDGGAVFKFDIETSLFWRVQRYIAIQGNQGLALRKRWLISNFLAGAMDGTYWGVGGVTTNYGSGAPAGYSPEVATMIADIRTDLDTFSEGEKAALENHGYLLAEAAVQQHLPQLVPEPSPQLKIPHPDWMDENRVKEALRGSSKRRVFGH